MFEAIKGFECAVPSFQSKFQALGVSLIRVKAGTMPADPQFQCQLQLNRGTRALGRAFSNLHSHSDNVCSAATIVVGKNAVQKQEEGDWGG